jgi:hypothetical protein
MLSMSHLELVALSSITPSTTPHRYALWELARVIHFASDYFGEHQSSNPHAVL